MTSKNVYERLHDKKSYTGVYRKRFEGDGRINADTQVSMMRQYHSKYDGDTNTGSNESIHCISTLMRPNLKYAKKKSSSVGIPGTAVPQNETLPPSPPQYESAMTAPPPPPVVTTLQDPHAILKYVFQYYCRFGRTGSKGAGERTLDNSNFAKFCRECPDLVTLSGAFNKEGVDLIFIKSKKKGARRLTYARFLDALGMIATKKFPALELEESVPLLLERHIATLPCLSPVEDEEPTTAPVISATPAQQAESVAPLLEQVK